jgi:hypothetical protein
MLLSSCLWQRGSSTPKGGYCHATRGVARPWHIATARKLLHFAVAPRLTYDATRAATAIATRGKIREPLWERLRLA